MIDDADDFPSLAQPRDSSPWGDVMRRTVDAAVRQMAADLDRALAEAMRRAGVDVGVGVTHRFHRLVQRGAETFYVDDEPVLRVHAPEFSRDGQMIAFTRRVEYLR